MQHTSSLLVLYIRCRLRWLGKATQSWGSLLSRSHASWIQKFPKSSSVVIQVGRDGEPENKPSVVVGLSDANALAVKELSYCTHISTKRRIMLQWTSGIGQLGFCKPLPPGPKSTVVATGDEHGSPRVHPRTLELNSKFPNTYQPTLPR